MVSEPEPIEAGPYTIRWWETGDADLLAEAVALSSDHLRPWMPWFDSEPMTVEQRAELITYWRNIARSGGDEHFGVFEKANVVGAVGLHRRVDPDGVEIGYWTHVRHVRRGIATAAARALASYAFRDAALRYVEIHHDEANHLSARIPRKLGFTLRGTYEAPRCAEGHSGRECVWRVNRSEWRGHF
ncbi:GNAT family N-acetyltransferase [Hoyosella altamirensis]|uniref:RimJ/RimL family protein N-acetyltransferase n=1 Tax=Hoyosella altamirensis TaxID=616997 RepID=A0A839RMV1_9ACTN|nr:GNAT family protein [Hoyosella altamirensis]MBB3037261.1 RimJ/RimL family protein N-acetyltransferase [Hoyosella altamirensis]